MADAGPRLSLQSLKVLGALMSANDKLSGVEISRFTALPSGTLHPILFRLESCGWLKSAWETADSSALGRPRRRFYSLTSLGRKAAVDVLEELKIFTGIASRG
jgi:DNA-binding PadR family transcriptional regulator